jgi:hypothetical protein
MKKFVVTLAISILFISFWSLAQESRWRDQHMSPHATENGAITTGGDQELNVTRKYTFGRSGLYPINAGMGIPNPTFEIDFSQSPPGAGNTFTANTGQTLTQNGSGISRVTDGTYPNGFSSTQGYEWTFNGTTDYITSSIGPPAGDFSAVCVVTPSANSANVIIIGNYSAGGKRGWKISQSAANIVATVSDDGTSGGGHITDLVLVNALSIGMTSIVLVTYDYISDGSSVLKIYSNKLVPASTTSADGPVYNNASNLAIAADGSGADTWYAGTISHCSYWDGTVLTPGQATAIINTWLGIISTAGIPVNVTSSTPPSIMVASPTSGTEPFLRNFGSNLNTITNNGTCKGLYGPSAITNLIRRSLFRTWNGADGGTGCGDYPTGWLAYCSAGDGTAGITSDNTTKAVDLYSARMVLRGTTSVAYMFSNCRTNNIGSNMKATTFYKCTSGSCESKIWIRQFTTATNCTGSYTDVSASCSGSSWTKCTLSHLSSAWASGTQSYRIMLSETGDGGSTISNWSAPMLRADSSSMPLDIDHFCGTDADSDAVCSTMVNATSSPYSANGPMTTTLTGCTPFAGTDIASGQYFVYDYGSGAQNAMISMLESGTDEPLLYVYDGAGAAKYIAPNVLNWAALTEYVLKFGVDGSGNLRLWWNSAWQTTMSGAGTGIRSAANANTYLCSSNAGGHNTYIRDLTIQAAEPTDATPEATWNKSVPH